MTEDIQDLVTSFKDDDDFNDDTGFDDDDFDDDVMQVNYCRIYSVRTNGPTLCPSLWLPYVPESVEKPGLFCIQMPDL